MKKEEHCNCSSNSWRCPEGIESMRCDYCGKPPESLSTNQNNMIYRHGDLLIVSTDSIPEGLKQKENTVLLEGETSGHMHQLDKATVFLSSATPSKDNDYLIGYFSTEEGALLTHQEHKTIEIPKGIYKFYAQREYDEQAERQVID